jgi:hypothetical protein
MLLVRLLFLDVERCRVAGAVLGGDAEIKHPSQHAFEGAGVPAQALAGTLAGVGGGD